jgi:replicative DNA helicase
MKKTVLPKKVAPESNRLELESKVLQGMLSHGEKAIPIVMKYLDGDEFISHEYHPRIFAALMRLYAKRAPVNLLTVSAELQLDERYTGGDELVYVSGITLDYFPHHELEYYCQLLVDQIVNDQAMTRVSKLKAELSLKVDDSLTLVKEFSHDLTIIFERFNHGNTEHISKARQVLTDRLGQLQKGIQFMRGKFFFHDIDKLTGGFDDGDMVVIAGEEKSGKSTLALQVALANARAGSAVQFFSLEMSREMLLLRAAIIESKISWTEALSNRLSGDKWGQLYGALDRISSLPLYVNDTICDVATIRSEIESGQKANDVKIAFVDYAQIVKPEKSSRRDTTREQEVAGISSGLKRAAKDLRLPIVVLSQLNKELTSRESKALQMDMDKMISIKAHEEFDEGEILNEIAKVDLRLKQRMGPSGGFGAITLGYHIPTGAFVNLEDRELIPPPTMEGF